MKQVDARQGEVSERDASVLAGARAAHDAGQLLFQAILPITETSRDTGAFNLAGTQLAQGMLATRILPSSALLGEIEKIGWQLEHVSHVFQPMATASRDKFLSSGQTETVSGMIIGVYVFRAATTDSRHTSEDEERELRKQAAPYRQLRQPRNSDGNGAPPRPD